MISEKEKEYLRGLAKQIKELSETEENQEKRRKWYAVNDLKEGAVPVFMNHYWPLALKEIFPDDTYVCEDPKAKEFEINMKTRIFYATELEDDNVIEPVIYSDVAFQMEDYDGLERKIRRSSTDTDESGAYEMVPVIVEEEDIDKLRLPKFSFDEKKTRENYEEACEIFEPILTVIKHPHTMAAKIADEYSWLRGMENTYMDMYDDPDWMKEALERIKKNFISRFKQMEDAGVWGTLDNSEPLGSAGLRYATGIPDFRDVKDPLNYHVKLSDSWGFTCAEVFNCVSNSMHDEFSFEYDKDVMSMFKYINVGCCEVLDHKVELAAGLPNTRKLSVSEWCDRKYAGEQIKRKYVYSYRAAGTHFVSDQWDKEEAEKEIREVLEASKANGCCTEIVLNIGGTLGKNPREKVIQWSHMVRKLINEYYG